MTTDTRITHATQQLLAARRGGQPVPACQLGDAGSAYAVQDAVAQALGWFADGTAGHWKSGGASPESVRTHAPLPPDGIFQHPADLRAHRFRQRGIEAEIALRLRHSVDARTAAALDEAAAMAMVDSMCVAIEIVESRWAQGMQAPAWDKLADLQSHGALVLGPWLPLRSRDWSTQSGAVTIGSRVAHRFQGTHALGSPTAVLPQWLRHATRGGTTVPAGTVVTTGTWCGLLSARAGDSVRAEFDGIGAVQLRF